MLPTHDELETQASWLAPARSQLLRLAGVARRRRVLDLGAGSGAVTGELVRRAGGHSGCLVVALDLLERALQLPEPFAGASRVAGDAAALPLADASLDLVFAQLAFLWMPAALAVAEVARVLAPGGALVALEPDYGGLMEYPPDVASGGIWRAALARAGADPLVGRKLPGLCAAAGLQVRAHLFDTLVAPSPTRFELLRGLPLTPEESAQLEQIEFAAAGLTAPWSQVAHLPFYLLLATKPTQR
jgi:SAM-dependent methyltransferase